MKRILMAAVILGALASTSAADRADDDLAAVKKAVGTTVAAQPEKATARPENEAAQTEKEAKPAEEPAPARAEKARSEERRAEEPRVAKKPRSRRGEPQWFRVRIAEKGEKHARVSVNLPLDLVRALGADLDLDDCHSHHSVEDVLRALDSGESLVDIEDEDATVHVWVE